MYLLVNGFIAPLVGLAFDRAGPRWVYTAGFACSLFCLAIAALPFLRAPELRDFR